MVLEAKKDPRMKISEPAIDAETVFTGQEGSQARISFRTFLHCMKSAPQLST
jgi:hypothetical protein